MHGFSLPSCCGRNLGCCALASVALDPATGAERLRTALRARVPIPLVQAEPPVGVLSREARPREVLAMRTMPSTSTPLRGPPDK